jgi:hypothetical protein
MRPESLKLFAELLESYIPEDSSASAVLTNTAGSTEVIQKLHKDMGLAHDQQYREVEKISWSELKSGYNNSWVLIKGSLGAGAIKAEGGGYKSVAYDPTTQTVTDYSSDRGGNNIDFLKSKIGKLRSFFVGKDQGDVEKKRRKRAEQGKPTDSQAVSRDTLVKKFRPLWLRAMTAAEADIKGMIATMIKNSAYEKAKRKMDQAGQLLSAIEKLETGSLEDTPEFVREAVNIAIMMASVHHYPEKTGEIRKDYRSYRSQFSEGPQQLLKDISEGDTAKLGTILTFFKRSLVSG